MKVDSIGKNVVFTLQIRDFQIYGDVRRTWLVGDMCEYIVSFVCALWCDLAVVIEKFFTALLFY